MSLFFSFIVCCIFRFLIFFHFILFPPSLLSILSHLLLGAFFDRPGFNLRALNHAMLEWTGLQHQAMIYLLYHDEGIKKQTMKRHDTSLRQSLFLFLRLELRNMWERQGQGDGQTEDCYNTTGLINHAVGPLSTPSASQAVGIAPFWMLAGHSLSAARISCLPDRDWPYLIDRYCRNYLHIWFNNAYALQVVNPCDILIPTHSLFSSCIHGCIQCKEISVWRFCQRSIYNIGI